MNELRKIERRWLKNFQQSNLVSSGAYQPSIAHGLFYGFNEDSPHYQYFKLGFQDFKDSLDYSDIDHIKKNTLEYLKFIGIEIKLANLENAFNSGDCTLDSLLKKTYYLLRQMARYDGSLDIRNPFYDNLGDLYFFMRIEASNSEANQQLSLFEEVPLPDFYNKYIELPENYEEDRIAIELFEEIENNSYSYFITGRAGTGKSTFIHYFTKNTKKNTLLFAFTGIAAINIGGQTLHSFFGFPFKPLLPGDKDIRVFNPHFQKYKILEKTDTIIVDEVSMLRSDLLQGLDHSLRINGGNPEKLFGGKQMIFVGDVFQLPPIVDRRDPLQNKVFSEVYESEYFFDSHSFKALKPKLFEFETVYRQSDDGFIERLNKVRNYQVTNDDIEYFNQAFEPYHVPHSNEFRMLLSSNNYIANTENQRRLSEIPYGVRSYSATIVGEFPVDKFPTLQLLELKRGAQVMFVKNDINGEGGRRWVNGTIGKVLFLNPKSIEVELPNGNIHEVGLEIWENRKYQWDKKERTIVSKVIGTFTQFPIKLAWAITIHKSQGLTFEKVTIDIGSGAFANGQLYTALSRCRSFVGLKLRRKISRTDIIPDSRLIEFSNSVVKGELISKRNFNIHTSEIETLLDELIDEMNISGNQEKENLQLVKYRLNSIIDFGPFKGITLEEAISHDPKYLEELLDTEHLVIAPSTLEIIENRLIGYQIAPSKVEEMKLKNERYNEQNR